MSASPRKLIRLILTLFGVLLLGVAGWQFIEQLLILKTWPEVQAEVTRSQLTSHVETREERIRDRDSDDFSSSPRTRTVRTTLYGATIDLRYTVNGQEYNSAATAGYETSNSSMMRELVQRYAPGTRHPIRYDPSNPGKIRIEVRASLLFFGLPLGVGILGAAMLLISLMFREKAGASPQGSPGPSRISMAMGMLADLHRGKAAAQRPEYFTELVLCPACRQQTFASQPSCMHCRSPLPPRPEAPKLK